uniref:Uncharacterized protein n=1 Tax=Tetraodon nigroviridis TaxID=99883 RepID=H3C9V7_TETNG
MHTIHRLCPVCVEQNLPQINIVRGKDGFGFTICSDSPVKVQAVDTGGPAHQSGLCQGDVVLQLNGLPVETWKCIDLAHAIRSCPSRIVLVVWRCLPELRSAYSKEFYCKLRDRSEGWLLFPPETTTDTKLKSHSLKSKDGPRRGRGSRFQSSFDALGSLWRVLKKEVCEEDQEVSDFSWVTQVTSSAGDNYIILSPVNTGGQAILLQLYSVWHLPKEPQVGLLAHSLIGQTSTLPPTVSSASPSSYGNYQNCTIVQSHRLSTSFGAHCTLAPKTLIFPVFVQPLDLCTPERTLLMAEEMVLHQPDLLYCREVTVLIYSDLLLFTREDEAGRYNVLQTPQYLNTLQLKEGRSADFCCCLFSLEALSIDQKVRVSLCLHDNSQLQVVPTEMGFINQVTHKPCKSPDGQKMHQTPDMHAPDCCVDVPVTPRKPRNPRKPESQENSCHQHLLCSPATIPRDNNNSNKENKRKITSSCSENTSISNDIVITVGLSLFASLPSLCPSLQLTDFDILSPHEPPLFYHCSTSSSSVHPSLMPPSSTLCDPLRSSSFALSSLIPPLPSSTPPLSSLSLSNPFQAPPPLPLPSTTAKSPVWKKRGGTDEAVEESQQGEGESASETLESVAGVRGHDIQLGPAHCIMKEDGEKSNEEGGATGEQVPFRAEGLRRSRSEGFLLLEPQSPRFLSDSTIHRLIQPTLDLKTVSCRPSIQTLRKQLTQDGGSLNQMLLFLNGTKSSDVRRLHLKKKTKNLAADVRSCLPFLQPQKSNAGVHGNSLEKALRNNRPSLKEVLRWAESLEALLTNQYGVTVFRHFLRSEFSEENLDFWLAVERFKQTRSICKMAARAKKIYNEFVSTSAARQVNMDSSVRETTLQSLRLGVSPASFQLAQDRIFTLMETDSYPRFLKSRLYIQLAKQDVQATTK